MRGISRRGLLGAAAGTVAAGTAAATAVPGEARATTGDAGPSLSFDAGPPRLHDTMDEAGWARFLAGADPRWRRLPGTFYEGPFLGNGGLGAAVYRQPTRRALLVELGDNRVRDHQEAGGPLFGGTRLRVGHLALVTVGEVTAVDLHLSLWDAELSGTVTTTAGSVGLRCFVHATRDLLVVELRPDAGERSASWSFTPYPAESPRLAYQPRPDGLVDNPEPVAGFDASGGSCVQDLVAGGGHATVWRVTRTGAVSVLVASVAASHPDRTAYATAERTVRAAAGRTVGELAGEHRQWWHRFYPRSFVSVPDDRTQSFYWIQLYKMASATRADRPVVSTSAQWLQPTPWPGTGWNRTVPLSYWLIHASGHGELDSLTATLRRCRDALVADVPAAYRGDSAGIGRASQDDLRTAEVVVPGSVTGTPEVGNLTWALHTAWLAYRHGMADGVLREVLYPLLRKAIGFYLHFLTEGGDGRLHLPATYSPEYATTTDCNYDLALLTWGCRTLLDATDRLGVDDPLRPRWRNVLDRLVEPPQGADGLWIGATRRLISSHRHYSHLLWFHPLHLLDPTDSTGRDLLQRSLNQWVGRAGARQGHTYTGAASMSALLGDGDRAFGYLGELFDRHLTPNTMYAESGPALETPLSGARSLHDMLLQSWGGVLRIFPAVPSGWADVTVHDLSAEGGFRVSAVRSAGRTRFVRIRSTAGEPCRVVPGLARPYRVQALAGGDPVGYRDLGGMLELDLPRGGDVLLTTAGVDPDLVIAPVAGNGTPGWGLPT